MPYMMKAKLLIIPLACLLAASCGVKTGPESADLSVALSFEPIVMQAPETKQTIVGTQMPNESTYGLFVCKHYDGSYTDGSNPYTPYALNYNNVKAARSSGIWYYTYFGYTNLKEFYLKGTDDDYDNVTDYNADIFAYAPYVQNMPNPEAIPFSITSATDVMYAAQNNDPSANKNIDPATAGSGTPRKLEVPLTFSHALALLEFDFRLKNPNTNHSIAIDPDTGDEIDMPTNASKSYTLDYIMIERTDGAHHPLYVSGKMNAMTGGTLSELATASAITVSGGNLNSNNTGGSVTVYSASNPARAYFLQVPSQDGDEPYADEDYLISFKFAGQNFPVTFPLLREHIMHSDGTTCGFKAGYKYTFNFLIDNYVHFEGVTVGEWETVEEPILQKDI